MSQENDRKRAREDDENEGQDAVQPATDSRENAKWDAAVSLEALRAKLQEFATERNWDQHHEPRNLALALVGEVGELCECFQWKKDTECLPGLPAWSEQDKDHLGEEMSDVLLYLLRLSDRCGINLAAAALKKLGKNAQKYPAHLVNGSRSKYTAYQDQSKEQSTGTQDSDLNSAPAKRPRVT
mmetsp:Transcript_47842/g.97805  ORF Transcript_47842/g.97805 Transcript_47842/m.97805 type:complete len:183 (+) Transcript_47842:33-581(+)